MHTQRFDIYRLIHKGLRAYLSDTLLAVGRMDLESTTELHSGLAALNGLLDFCESHLRHENTFIHPAMERAEPGSAEGMNHHHQHHEALIAELRAMVHQLKHAEASMREGLAAQLYRIISFQIVELSNLSKENQCRFVLDAFKLQALVEIVLLMLSKPMSNLFKGWFRNDGGKNIQLGIAALIGWLWWRGRRRKTLVT